MFARQGVETVPEMVIAFFDLAFVVSFVLEEQLRGSLRQLRPTLSRSQKPAHFHSYEAQGPVRERPGRIVFGEVPPQGDRTLLQNVTSIRTVWNGHQNTA